MSFVSKSKKKDVLVMKGYVTAVQSISDMGYFSISHHYSLWNLTLATKNEKQICLLSVIFTFNCKFFFSFKDCQAKQFSLHLATVFYGLIF